MNSTFYKEPVTVLVGLGFPRKVESAAEAYQLLSDMCLTASQAALKVAMQACKAAIEGKIDAETARSAFVAFANRNAMLLSRDASVVFEPNVHPSRKDANNRRDVTLSTPVPCVDLKPISA